MTGCFKILRVVDGECGLSTVIEDLIEQCSQQEWMSPAVVKEVIVYHAIRGEIEECVRLIQANEKLLLQSVVYFDYCLSILVSTLVRSPGVIQRAFECQEEKSVIEWRA